MRKIPWGRAISALVIGAITLFAVVNFRFVSEPENVGATGEACSNRFHAAQGVLQSLGAPIKVVASLNPRDPLPPRGTIILLSGVTVAGRQWQQLLTWVDAGGHLIVEVEGADMASRLARTVDGCDVGGWSSPSANPALDAFDVHPDEENTDDSEPKNIEMEEGRAPISVKFGANPTLYTEEGEPDWSAPSRDAANVMEFLSGEGRVTFVNSLQFADNWHIGEAQNAAFLWGLIAVSHQTPAAIWLVQFTNRPSFLRWLWLNGAAPILAAGIFIALWIWFLVPRFGPLQPDTSADRRSLTEHLRASGRLAFRRDATLPLLEQAREQCKALLARRVPGAELSHPEKIARVGADLTSMSSDALFDAFTREPRHAREITQIAQTLSEFRRRLTSSHLP